MTREELLEALAGSEPVDTYADTLNSDDLHDRLEYLSDFDRSDMDSDQQQELDVLTAACEELSSRGILLISDDYFTEYAKELAEDVTGYAFYDWPLTAIDWDTAAEYLQADYSTIDLDGQTYWYQA